LTRQLPGPMVDLERKKEEKTARRKTEDRLNHRREHGEEHWCTRVRVHP
jgi:hypothetical protein